MYYVYILTSMRYTDSFMDGAGAHPPFLLHTLILPVTSMYILHYILCIFKSSPQSMVNIRLNSIQYHTGIIYC